MNGCSHPNDKNSFGMFPASGPLRGTAGQITVFFLRQLNRRGGVPFRGGGVHRIWGMGVALIIIEESSQIAE
jgi:hypothetical protein